jgi:hypothetical protein
MSRGRMGIGIAGGCAPVVLWLAASLGGQEPPATPPQEKQDEQKGAKKGADRLDTKAAAVVRLNVEVSSDGAPLPDALVLVKQAGGFARQSSTNSSGVAHFSQVPRGKTTVQVTAVGCKPNTREEELAGAEVNLAVALEKQ